MSSRGEKTDFGPGKTSLYFNNVGLFSDPFLEDRLPNLEKYYSHPSTQLLNDYWNIDESDPIKYNESFQRIQDLWNKLDQNVPKYCSKERQLQNSWIDRIFEYLGWTIELEETSSRHGITNYPDYALFGSQDDWKKSKSLSGNNKFKTALAVADAKDWSVNLDGKGNSNKNPSFQIINYLKQTGKDWGILTNGKFWRIYSLRSDSKHAAFYEVDLEKILATGDYQRFKYFYNFFRSDAFIRDAKLGDRTFLDFVFEDGKFYSARVEKNLDQRVYRVASSICRGFLSNFSNPTEQDLKDVYENSMYYLFKLMFVLNCESKGLLEVNKQDDYYENSLRKKCLEIKEQFEQSKNWSQQPRTYNFILELFDLLKSGDEKIGVHGFGNDPFEIGNKEFYLKNKISDDFLNASILDLACDKDENGDLQFIDYKILSPDHIGSLFEGLLEFNLVKSGKDYELANTKGDRKSTGSYYTPDYLVDYIVDETLGELVANKEPAEILNLKILDPSMGSGHFLLGVVKYLEKTIIELQDTEIKIRGAIEFDKIRKSVLKNCVFGVDINPLATQLAKFSLWIYTSQKGDFLEPLGDQFIEANSLLDEFKWDEVFKKQLKMGKVDAVVGNPPYIGEKGNKSTFEPVIDSSLGKRFHKGKMDYFYFFFHLAIDLLRDGGKLGYISTNYYPTAHGALNLREDLKKRTRVFKTINFGELKIFKGAAGQHNQITFLEKGFQFSGNCEIIDCKLTGVCTREMFETKILPAKSGNKAVLRGSISQSDLFDDDESYMRIQLSDSKGLDSCLTRMEKFKTTLSDLVNLNTGAHITLDCIKGSHLKKYSDGKYADGEGVFVLSNDEAKALKLNKVESSIIKNFIKNSDIHSFVEPCPSSKLIYLRWEDEIADKPNLERHLKKYKRILVDKMESYGEEYPWYAIHRPRNQFIFDSHEKIVFPYRAKKNIFAYSKTPIYGSGDVMFVTKKEKVETSIKAINCLLNSKAYYVWLYFKGKRKGETLELYIQPLSEVKIPALSKQDVVIFEKINDELYNGKSIEENISKLNEAVYKVLKFTRDEIDAVERFYSEKIDSTANNERDVA